MRRTGFGRERPPNEQVSLMARKRVQPGDVVEFHDKEGLVYGLCLGAHADYGTGLLLWPQLHQHRPTTFETQTFVRDGYFIFHPADASIRQGRASIAGRIGQPPMPTSFRRSGGCAGPNILSWVIEQGGRDRPVRYLTEREAELPIARIWTHRYIFEMVLRNWRPADDGRGTPPGEPEPTLSWMPESGLGLSTDDPQRVRHYLYLATQAAANQVAAEARGKDLEVTVRQSAAGPDWLVQVIHSASSPEELDAVSDRLATVVQRYGGEYDGWEVEVG